MPLNILFNANDEKQDGYLDSFDSQGRGLDQQFVRGDQNLVVSLRPVVPSTSSISNRFWDDDHKSGDTYKVAIGNPDQAPISGTFPLSLGGSSTGLTALTMDAAVLQTQISAAHSGSYGAVSVVLVSPGVFQVTWAGNGAVPALDPTGGNTLAPNAVVNVVVDQAGDAGTRAIQYIVIRQTPVAYCEPSTVFAAAGVVAAITQAGDGSHNKKYSVTLVPGTYGGNFSVTLTKADATVVHLTAGGRISADDFKTLLGVSCNVTRENDVLNVEFTGDQGLSNVPVIAVTNIDLLAPKGVSGLIQLNTISLYRAFWTSGSSTSSLTFTLSIKRTRTSGEKAELFQHSVILKRNIIDVTTMTSVLLADYYTTTESDARFVGIADVLSYGAQVFTPEKYGAVGDGVTDDFTAVQAAVTAAQAVGGKVVLSKTYAISDTPVVSGAISIEGTGVNALYGDRSVYGSDVMPTASPYLTGAVLLQTTAAKDGLKITTVGKSVNLRNFGIRFAESIKFTNTGYGVLADPGAYSGHKNNGVCGGRWESVYVYGHDGNHYAFLLINQELMVYSNIESWGGGGVLIAVDSSVGWYGNQAWINPYFLVLCAGNSHGIWLHNAVAGHGVIYTTMVRPQVFMFGMSDGQALAATGLSHIDSPSTSGTPQYQFLADADVQYLNVTGADMEQAGATGMGVSIPTLDAGSSWVGGFGADTAGVGTLIGHLKSVNRSFYPTTDPLVDGQLWLDSGVLTVSSG